MFGHNDHHDETTLPEPDAALAHDGNANATAPAVDDTGAGSYMDDVPAPATVSPTTAPATDDADDDGATVAPPVEDTPPEPAADLVTSTPAETTAAPATVVPNTDKLLDIKQQALQQLTPLVGHLEQSPEEKFRTTMMMIQASDNHELVGTAYEAAQQIPDEKVRAQALLDIVNEINYFTHSGTEA